MAVLTPTFPTTLDTTTTLGKVVNFATTTVGVGGVDASATTVPITSTTGWPSDGVCVIGTEAIAYTGTTSTSITGCTRGFDGTTVASHAAGDPAYGGIIISAHYEALRDQVLALQGELGVTNGAMAARALKDRGGQVYNVKAWGATGDGTTNDTATIQAAIDAVPAGTGAVIYFPPGTYNHTGLTANKRVILQGSGVGSTYLNNTHASNVSVTMDLSLLTGTITTPTGVRDLTLCAGGINNFAAGTNSGYAIHCTQSLGDTYFEHIAIRNHGGGIRLQTCWYTMVQNFSMHYITGAFIKIDGSAGAQYISQGKISNYGATGTVTAAIGIHWTEGGGLYCDAVDITTVNTALVVAPTAAVATTYGFFDNCLFDTSTADGVLIDGSTGFPVSMHFDNCWASYTTTGSGLHVKGANTDGVFWDGGRIRENGLHGVFIEAGINVRISDAEIARNSKATTLTGDGVNVAASQTQWSVQGCRIGNFASGLTHEQRYGINVGASADNYQILGNDLRLNTTAAVNGVSVSATKLCFGNLPDTVNTLTTLTTTGTITAAARITSPEFYLTKAAGFPSFTINDPTAAADEKTWLFMAQPTGILTLLTDTDAGGGSVEWLRVDRTGAAIDSVTLGGTIVTPAGTTTRAPLRIPSGTNLTTPIAGAVEYDGVKRYWTNNTTSGREMDRAEQYYRLPADSAALASAAIADYFPASSSFPYVAGGEYELLFDLTFLKTTAGTVTFTVLFSTAPTYGDLFMLKTPIAGAMTTGAPESMILTSTTSTTIALGPTGLLTTAVNHHAQLKLYFVANTAGNVRMRITPSAGTVTPRRGSRYFVQRLPAANVGTFV